MKKITASIILSAIALSGCAQNNSNSTNDKNEKVMKLITIEEHVSDPAIAAATEKVLGTVVPYTDIRTDNLPDGVLEEIGAARIVRMDNAGIDVQILSYINSPQFLPAAEAIPLVRAANDRLAAAVKVHPARFAAFAMLPLSDPQAAADELRRTVTKLEFKGALIAGRPSTDAVFLDDLRFAPVLEAANELKVPIYLHPGYIQKDVQEVYYSGFDPRVSSLFSLYGWGWHNEAGIQVIRMILAGVFDKYPDLQVISGHWGEMVPFFLDRMDNMLPQRVTGLKQSIKETYKNHVYVTPSGMFTWPQFQFIMEELGADRIMYSVDYPYVNETGAKDFLENAPISQENREKIAHGNAEKLFNLQNTNSMASNNEQTGVTISARDLYDAFMKNDRETRRLYTGKIITVTGIAVSAGPDAFGIPSVGISDKVNGKTYALCLLPDSDSSKLRNVSINTEIAFSGECRYIGGDGFVVMKHCEIIGK